MNDEKAYQKKYREEHKKERREYWEKNKNRINLIRKTWYKKNHTKALEKQKDYYYNNKEMFENHRLKRLFNISLNQYNQMFEEQGGKCAVCGSFLGGENQYGKVKLHVDHNHLTGKVRGLLCYRCNTALGSLQTDDLGIELLCSAISYLRNSDEI